MSFFAPVITGKHPIEWILRVAVFGTFLGHGLVAMVNMPENWANYLSIVGIPQSIHSEVFITIGIVDLVVAVLVLVRPFKAVVLYCFVWALATALMRPIAGEGVLQFVERAANFGAPLALYFWLRYSASKSSES